MSDMSHSGLARALELMMRDYQQMTSRLYTMTAELSSMTAERDRWEKLATDLGARTTVTQDATRDVLHVQLMISTSLLAVTRDRGKLIDFELAKLRSSLRVAAGLGR